VRLRAIVGVVAPGGGTPTGTVQFTVDGSAVGGPAAVDQGVAQSAPIPDLQTGSHAIEADFTPSGPFAASHAQAATVVDPVATTTTLTSSTDPAVAGRDLRFTVTVAATQGAARPVGEIQLLVDGSAYGAPIPLVGGRAVSPSTDDLPAGTHVVDAHYHGYGPFDASRATLRQQVVNPPSGGGGGGGVPSTSAPTQDGPAADDDAAPIELTPQPTLILDGGAVRVDAHGTAHLTAECRALAGQRCTGTLTLRLAGALRARGRQTAARGTVVAGRRVALTAGTRAELAVDLTTQGERLIDGRRELRTEPRADGVALDATLVVLRASRAHALHVQREAVAVGAGERTIRVRVRCSAPRGERCRGTLRTGAHGPAVHVDVAGGRTETVRLHLSPSARRALARRGATGVHIRATSELTVGLPARTSTRIEARTP
jgi:hypothetical protein